MKLTLTFAIQDTQFRVDSSVGFYKTRPQPAGPEAALAGFCGFKSFSSLLRPHLGAFTLCPVDKKLRAFRPNGRQPPS